MPTLLRNQDQMISCDTAVAHLAGALGAAAWVALSFVPDWRWLLGREDSPRYPSPHLFRQPRPVDWDHVFARMAAELRQWLGGPSGAARGRAEVRSAEAIDTSTRATLTACGRKAVSWDELLARREQARRQNQTVVWTNGCFDLLHVGHVRSLQAARNRGEVLVVGVNSDASVRQLKGSARPILPAAERVELLAALECVDYVVVFDELTPAAALARLKPDIHCKGVDYAPPDGKPIPEAAVVASYGGRIEFLPLVPSLSTSDLVRRIRAGEGADRDD